MKKNYRLVLLASLLPSMAGAVETEINGFGSIIGTTLLGDEGYWVKHPSGAGRYDDDVGFEIEEESLIGLQGTFIFDERFSVTSQFISRGQEAWKPTVEQFYVSFDPSSSWNFKMGKMRSPVYMFSDSMDVHYSFGWLRTPGTTYSLSANFYEGLSAMYSTSFGELSTSNIVYYGKTNKAPDLFLTELFQSRGFRNTAGSPLVEYQNNIDDVFGITSEWYYGDFTLHLAYKNTNGEVATSVYADQTSKDDKYPWREFYDVAVSYDDGNMILMAEWNQYKEVYTSYYVAGGMYIDQLQLLLTYGENEGELMFASGFVPSDASQEKTNMIALTARYEIAPGLALKGELIKFGNEGSLIVRDVDGDNEIDSTVMSIAFDFLF